VPVVSLVYLGHSGLVAHYGLCQLVTPDTLGVAQDGCYGLGWVKTVERLHADLLAEALPTCIHGAHLSQGL
jgi:hypothetical protein